MNTSEPIDNSNEHPAILEDARAEAHFLETLSDESLTGESLTQSLWAEDEIQSMIDSIWLQSTSEDGVVRVVDPVQPESASELESASLFELLDDFYLTEGTAQTDRHDLRDTVTKAYLSMHCVFPEDHVIIDEPTNKEFITRCRLLGATVDEYVLNKALLNARKAGFHKGIERQAVPPISRELRDDVLFAAELSARAIQWHLSQKQRHL